MAREDSQRLFVIVIDRDAGVERTADVGLSRSLGWELSQSAPFAELEFIVGEFAAPPSSVVALASVRCGSGGDSCIAISTRGPRGCRQRRSISARLDAKPHHEEGFHLRWPVIVEEACRREAALDRHRPGR